MADLINIARPYARAAFECAHEKGQLQLWKNFLEAAALIAHQKEVARVLENPEVLPSQLLNLFESVLAIQQLDSERKNFLHLLAQNRRLAVLPEISKAFNAFCAQLEKISNVRLVTAVEIKEDFKQSLISALTKRIQHNVTLHCEVDPAILGGAVLYMDMDGSVIDGSIRGKLTRLLESLLR